MAEEKKSRFKTTELSDPRFESNNLRFITINTPNLKGRGDICVFVPPGEDLKDLPIVTLMHGVYGSAWIWAHKAGVHLTAMKLIQEGKIKPMVIAMPSDGLWEEGSGYLKHSSNDFESWIAEDVVDAVIENIQQTSKESDLFISGLSMGGYGALRIGAKYPEKYKAISGHSSITNVAQMPLFVADNVAIKDVSQEEEGAVIHFMKQNKKNLPPFRFDCGEDDLLIEHNRQLHKELEEAGIEHIYEEFLGKHEWPYWEEHVKDTLKFFNKF